MVVYKPHCQFSSHIEIWNNQGHDPTEFDIEYCSTIKEADDNSRLCKILSGTYMFMTLKFRSSISAKPISEIIILKSLFFISDFFGNQTNVLYSCVIN